MPQPSDLLNKTNLLVALPLGAVAVMEGVLGIDIPGVQLEENWLEALLAALGIFSFRDTFRKILNGLR